MYYRCSFKQAIWLIPCLYGCDVALPGHAIWLIPCLYGCESVTLPYLGMPYVWFAVSMGALVKSFLLSMLLCWFTTCIGADVMFLLPEHAIRLIHCHHGFGVDISPTKACHMADAPPLWVWRWYLSYLSVPYGWCPSSCMGKRWYLSYLSMPFGWCPSSCMG